jgi:hypothetical protein
MDIAALSTSMAQSNIATQVGFAVLNLAKDSAEQNSAQLIEMLDTASMERSVNPNVGGNIDIQI